MKIFKITSLVVMMSLMLADACKAVDFPGGVNVSGDFRYWHDSIFMDGFDATHRHRIRARIGVSSAINNDLDVSLRLTSGSDMPTSSNQTLGDAFSTKSIGLDMACLTWTPDELNGASILAGKMVNPFLTVCDLVWDGDVTPEGLAIQYSQDVSESSGAHVNAGFFWLEQRSSAPDTTLVVCQFAFDTQLDTFDVLLGVSVYAYQGMEGYATLFEAGNGYGNSVTDAGLYANDFVDTEFFLKAEGLLTDRPFAAYCSVVSNSKADSNQNGFLVGATLGKLKRADSWEVDVNYRSLQKDAVVGVLADSDAFGGGTDGKGLALSGKYQISENWQAGLLCFFTQVGISETEQDYSRYELDLSTKF